MKLSEAIRIGAAKHPQTENFFVRRAADGQVIGTCAIGAAMVGACDQVWLEMGAREVEKRFPCLIAARATHCPKCEESWHNLFEVVTHLNDTHYEPRERIADWLEEQGL